MRQVLLYQFLAKTKCLLLVLLTIGTSLELHAQIPYQVTQNPLPVNPTFPLPGKIYFNPGTGSVIDNSVHTVPFTPTPPGPPLVFNFNGKNYTELYMSANGFVTFGSAPALDNTTPLSSTESYDGAISIFGADLIIQRSNATENIGYEISGTAPNRIIKLEWIVKRKGDPNITANLGMQLWLYETSGQIEMYYVTYAPNNTPVGGQIGLRGTSNADFKNLFYDPIPAASWPSAPAIMAEGIANDAVVKTSSQYKIVAASNRKFIWTPDPCIPPSRLTVSAITPNSATITWSAVEPVPTAGYQYYLTTSATPPTSSTTPTGNTTSAMLTANLSALSSATQYYVYVRSNCGAGITSIWHKAEFLTPCPPVNVPYFQYFDQTEPGYTYTVPNIPPCSSVQSFNDSNTWYTEPFYLVDGFSDEVLTFKADAVKPANSWFFTQAVNLVAGQSYRMSYDYGGSSNLSNLENKLEVKYGTSAAAAAMTSSIANHPSIKTSPISNVVNFVPPTSGAFYFGFHAYSGPNMGRLFVDIIEVVPSICIKPSGLSVGLITGNTALLTWSAPTPLPAQGYAYYMTTTSTPPSYTATPSGYTTAGTTVVNLAGMLQNTTYYVWVRGNCGSGDFSEWSDPVSFTTLNPPVYTYCIPAPSSTDNSGIINVTVGSINNSTGIEPGYYGNYSAMVTNAPQGSTQNVSITLATGYTWHTRIWVDWNNDSDFADAGEMVAYLETTNANPTTVTLSFVVPAGASLGQHRMRIGGSDQNNLLGTGAGQGPCYNGSWGAFEDYTINVVVPPPALTLSSNSNGSQCAGQTSPLVNITAGLANYSSFTWSPAIGVSGDATSGYTFTSATTITYTLTAVQTAFPYSSNTASYTYTANAIPTPIIINPATPSTCLNGPPVLLTASGGVVSGVAILEENFNGTAPTWTRVNASTGGNVANAAWTLRPNGYSPGGSSGIPTLVSNDATQFMISNSDAQGSSTSTNVTLTSPSFSLASYTNASMSFYHYYKAWINGSARVEIFSAGAWTLLPGLSWGSGSTFTQGTATNFSHVVYDLAPYLGQTGLQIRFVYNTNWGYVWALDNFKISGSTNSEIKWSPATGLFTNAAGTIPYILGTPTNTVYALPSATTTYTASASTLIAPFCSTFTPTTVTINGESGVTVSPVSQIVCGTATAITASGSASVLNWQYATNAAFTVGVITIPASASLTLTAAQIGTFTGIRYYRAVFNTGGCASYSQIAEVNFNSVTIWNGTWSNGQPDSGKKVIFNANYSSTANIDACSVEITGGNVVINPGHILHVENGVTRTAGTLTFENDASLVQVNDVSVNSGYIVYKRTTSAMNRFDYTYWSSPLTPQTLYGLSPLTMPDKYFAHNAATGSWVQVPSSTTMTKGIGYIVRAGQNHHPTNRMVFPAVFDGGANNGVPNNGVVNIPITKVGANDLNLIGNPYPSALDVMLFVNNATNSSTLDGTIYLWSHNTTITGGVYNQNDFALFNALGGTGTAAINSGVNNAIPTKYIASGQGFFIRGLASGNVVMNNSMRANGNNDNFYKSATPESFGPDEKHRIWLEMTGSSGAFKQILVGYATNATNGLDRNFDGLSADSGVSLSLYSIVENNQLTIQGRALPFTDTDIVPLGFRSSTAESYTIKLADFDGLFNDSEVGIYLEDRTLNIIHDLRVADYTFISTVGIFDQRFVLRFNTESLSTSNLDFNENSIVVYKNQNGLFINAGTQNLSKVSIFDIRGRQISQQTVINSNSTQFSNLPITEQILLVKIETTDGRISTRKVIF